MGNVLAPDDDERLPGLGRRRAGSAPTCCATARTRTSGPRSTAALASPGLAQAEQLHGKEMSYNNYVDADAAWRAAYDHADPCVAIIKHANPCGIAVGAGHRRGAPQGARLRPGLGLRRRDRGQPRGRPDDGRAGRRDLHRGGRARRRSPTTPSRVLTGEEEHPAAAAAARPAAAGAEIRPVTGGLLLQTGDRLDAPGDDPTTWTLATGEPLDAAGLADLVFAWRAVRAVKQQRDPAGPRPRDRRRRHGPGQPGRLRPARRGAGRGAGGRVGRRLATRSSRSPTACRCCSTPGCGPSSSRAGRCATRRSSRRPRRPA